MSSTATSIYVKIEQHLASGWSDARIVERLRVSPAMVREARQTINAANGSPDTEFKENRVMRCQRDGCRHTARLHLTGATTTACAARVRGGCTCVAFVSPLDVEPWADLKPPAG